MFARYFLFLIIGNLSFSAIFGQESDTTLANLFYQKGEDFIDSRTYDSALYFYQKAEKIYKVAGLETKYINSKEQIGLCYFYKRDKAGALKQWNEVLEFRKKIFSPDDLTIGNLYNKLGAAANDMGKYAQAKRYFEEAMRIRLLHRAPDDPLIAPTYYNIGLVNLYQGEYRESLRFFQKAKPVYLKEYGPNGSRTAQLYNNIGLCYSRLGDYGRSLEYSERAVAIHINNHGTNYWNLAFPYMNLGRMHDNLKNKEKAQDYYQKTFEISTQYDHLKDLQSKSLYMLGKSFYNQKDYSTATSYYNKAIKLTEEFYGMEHPDFATYYNALGDIEVKKENIDRANSYYQKSLDLQLRAFGPHHPFVSDVYSHMAFMYWSVGEYDKSLEYYQKTLIANAVNFFSADVSENPPPETAISQLRMISAIRHKAKVFRSKAIEGTDIRQNLELALECYLRLTELIDFIRKGYVSEQSKLLLQENAIPVFENGIKICYQLFEETGEEKYQKMAFFFMEKSKATILAETLQAAQHSSFQGVPDEVTVFENLLNERIQETSRRLSNEKQKGKTADTILVADLADIEFKLKTSLDSLSTVINQNFPEYYSLKYDLKVATAEEVMSQLGDNEATISYFVGDTTWYMIALNRDEIRFLELAPEKVAELGDLSDFRAQFSQGTELNPALLKQAYLLYLYLIESPLENWDKINKLMVIADGGLGHIPFDLLITKDPAESIREGKKPYLIYDYTISYAPSMTVYLNATDDVLSNNSASYIGFAPKYDGMNNDSTNELFALRDNLAVLSGIYEEVESAKSLWGGKAFLKEQATEGQFKSMKESPAILHLAMHALVDDEEPLNSKLVFSQDSVGEEDGFLNAYEIYGLELKSQLAVLSACNSGSGYFRRGEGIMSLSRAFMYAGCPSIVMSLWPARDKPTKTIMEHFFLHLKEGMPQNEALRQAKLDYLSKADPLGAMPSNWAAFVFVGKTTPLNTGLPFTFWKWALAFLIAGGVVFWLNRRARKIYKNQF